MNLISWPPFTPPYNAWHTASNLVRCRMVISFRDKQTGSFFEGERVKAFQGFELQGKGEQRKTPALGSRGTLFLGGLRDSGIVKFLG